MQKKTRPEGSNEVTALAMCVTNWIPHESL